MLSLFVLYEDNSSLTVLLHHLLLIFFPCFLINSGCLLNADVCNSDDAFVALRAFFLCISLGECRRVPRSDSSSRASLSNGVGNARNTVRRSGQLLRGVHAVLLFLKL